MSEQVTNLKRQITELEEIIKLKDRRISELEKLRIQPQSEPYTITYSPPQTIPLECQHEYPNPWYGIIPPPCKKCGKLGSTVW